jgi:carbon-monoxide dehydrogenase medium subunit
MREFKIAEPRTADELAALLTEATEPVALMAGGTDLMDELKSGVAAPAVVVDLRRVAGLAGVAGRAVQDRRDDAGRRSGRTR